MDERKPAQPQSDKYGGIAMRQWTLEERYRILKGPEDIRDLYDRIQGSFYRQRYHVQPITGLSSDPNGFAFYEGKWHLFYQWCPWGAVHGLKYWYHAVSADLMSWENCGVGIWPDTFFDNKGCHSGSAIASGDDLYFFYTGNHRDENWVRTPFTCAARMNADGKLEKLEKPLFGPRDDYAEHQRDPKIIYVPEKKKYFIFIGAQTLDKKGTALIYESPDLLSGWQFAGQLNVSGYEDFGGMWECPCIVRISGKDVLIFSPQYTTLPGRGNSTNHNVYLIGRMDYDTLTFTPESDFQYLDYGFDFYAAQCCANVEDPDKAILVSWIGLPDNHYPTEEEDWEGSLTLPRELRIRDGRLVQTPVSSIFSFREAELDPDLQPAGADDGAQEDTGRLLVSGAQLPRACELEAVFQDGSADLNLFTRKDGSGGFTIHYDAAARLMTVSRTGMEKRFNENVFETISFSPETDLKKISAFIDSCSVELFINDGEKTFTSHIYPTAEEHHFAVSENARVKVWGLKTTVTDKFVV